MIGPFDPIPGMANKPLEHDNSDTQKTSRDAWRKGWRTTHQDPPTDPLDNLRATTDDPTTVLEQIATAQRAGLNPRLEDAKELLACGIAPQDLFGALHATNYIRESVKHGLAARTVAAVLALAAPHSDPTPPTNPKVSET